MQFWLMSFIHQTDDFDTLSNEFYANFPISLLFCFCIHFLLEEWQDSWGAWYSSPMSFPFGNWFVLFCCLWETFLDRSVAIKWYVRERRGVHKFGVDRDWSKCSCWGVLFKSLARIGVDCVEINLMKVFRSRRFNILGKFEDIGLYFGRV